MEYLLLFAAFFFAPYTGSQAASAMSPPASAANPFLVSKLQTIGIEGDNRPNIVYSTQGHFEAPNWTRDGKSLLFNQDGKIMRISIKGGTPIPVDVGSAAQCGGNHGLSPDGALLAISCSTPDLPGSRIYIVPSIGGTPRLVTERSGAYWHSWSPDGKTLFFTRPFQGSLNIYSILVDGHDETPLTFGSGTNDDPDITPDGKYIYFNSDRTGAMQIWRMHPDGSFPEQITSDDLVNWTPHVSPDGKWMVFLSYEKGTTGHPANQKIQLRLMSLKDRTTKVLTSLIGGAGTINVPSWAPDSRRLAFVGYELATPR
jgi:Tol biopolymer transport system component